MKRLFCTILTLMLLCGPTAGQNVISISAGAAASGDTGRFTVVMKNGAPVNGANFHVQYDPSVITPFSINAADRAALLNGPGASVFGGNLISFVLFDKAGATLAADSGKIFEVLYTVADSIHDSTATHLTFTGGAAADSNLADVPFDYVDGDIPVSPATGVEGTSSGVPATYRLFQNYPNPFNPSTIIRYDLPRQSMVTITVYNLLGQRISTLVNEVVGPGTHALTWDAAGMPAGVYFCRLTAGGYSATTKLLLLK